LCNVVVLLAAPESSQGGRRTTRRTGLCNSTGPKGVEDGPRDAPSGPAERRIAEINRLLEKLQRQVTDHYQVAAHGRWTDDLAHIQHRLAELVGEEK